MEIPILLKANEVAEILNVSPRALATWRANNPDDLPFVRLGNITAFIAQPSVRFKVHEVSKRVVHSYKRRTSSDLLHVL